MATHTPDLVTMQVTRWAFEQPEIIYPESDGLPMSDNTRQFHKIVTIQGGTDALMHDRPDVFVAGDLLWYPVEGRPDIRVAPDVMVVFGRPKGHRGSYLQWREENIPPQVVFEVLSPGNTVAEMTRKRWFYEQYGVEEYYLYDPDANLLEGWLRTGDRLLPIPGDELPGWISPRLGVRFELEEDDLVLYRPDGTRFLTYMESETQRAEAASNARAEHERAEQERQRAEQEHERAEQERQRAEQEHERAEQERQRAERLVAQLRALGINPEE